MHTVWKSDTKGKGGSDFADRLDMLERRTDGLDSKLFQLLITLVAALFGIVAILLGVLLTR